MTASPSGTPLVLLHGWAADRPWWYESGYVDELKDAFRLVLVDLRGHGASDKPYDDAYRTFVKWADRKQLRSLARLAEERQAGTRP